MKMSGGDKLDKALSDIAQKVSRPGTLKVGFLEGSRYPDGTSVAMVAAIQNFGAPAAGIPARPFFSNMIAEKSGEWAGAIATNLVATDYDVKKTLGRTGMAIQQQLKQSIIDTMDPPLSPVTLMLRKMRAKKPGMKVNKFTVLQAAARVRAGDSFAGVSTKPLVDTGQLLDEVAYQVSD